MADVAGASAKPQTLDDIMMAMDVVDTLRHREDLVRRELDETGREADLINRLREIYRQQGIEVPGSVLADGVKALKESRFVYTPAPAGWTRTLLTFWVRRIRFATYAGLFAALIVAGWGAYYFGVVRPNRMAAERAHIELTQTLPNAIRTTYSDIVSETTDPAAKAKADQLIADGDKAIRDGNRAAMERVRADLGALQADLNREYTLTIVSRPGEPTGVWRRPPGGILARNYYLIVEPIAPNGQKLKLPVRNEETGETETVDKFGVRVSQQVFDNVGQEKRADGIVQNNRFGVKRRGTLSVDYKMPFEGGMLTKW
jgi:Family of unknown function (DUF6384)